MKRLASGLFAIIFIILSVTGCNNKQKNEYTKYSAHFFDTFNTMTVFLAYTKSEEEYDYYFNKLKNRFEELHKLYDIYNNYEGINNLKTINDNAGIKPVQVDKEIIGLLKFAVEWDNRTEGFVNVALGPVLSIWHEYREEGLNDPENAKVPSEEELSEAALHTDIKQVIIDEENSTVLLQDKKMSLDVGAVAKGYATELAAKELREEGLESGIISAGGNIRTIGKPMDGIRDRWGISLQDPDKPIMSDEENSLDIVFVGSSSVVSSGDYERYYEADGKRLHHLIDPNTLMPGDHYRAVTIVTEDSGIADALSTAIFLMPYDKSRELAESIDGVEALWIMKNGEIRATEGMEKIRKSKGATGTK